MISFGILSPNDGKVFPDDYANDPDTDAVSPVFEFNTFTGLRNTTPATDIPAQICSRSGYAVCGCSRHSGQFFVTTRYVLDQTVLGTIDSDVLALADAPADFDSLLRPEVGAKAYQSGTGTPLFFDAIGDERHKAGFSKGAFEPV